MVVLVVHWWVLLLLLLVSLLFGCAVVLRLVLVNSRRRIGAVFRSPFFDRSPRSRGCIRACVAAAFFEFRVAFVEG